MLEPIWKEITKKQYYNAKLKYDVERSDIYGFVNSWAFEKNYWKKPVYRKNCGVQAMLDGSGIVGYQYFKRVGYRNFLIMPAKWIEDMRKQGIIK